METIEQEIERIPYNNYPMSMIYMLRISNVLCSDGKRRTATTTACPDTCFSQPARIHVTRNRVRKTVTGFIHTDYIGEGMEQEYRFTPNLGGKNYAFYKGEDK